MKRTLWLTLMVLAVALVFAVGAVSAGQRQARDLVFEDEDSGKKPAAGAKTDTDQQAVVKVKAAVMLNREGKDSQVLPSADFKSGDKIKLIYTTNIDCYVYWLQQGSSGDYTMLFPNAKTGMENWVKKNEEQTIPVKGAFKFDDNKGVEKVLLVMAPDRIPELEEAAKVAAVKGGAVKDLQDKQDNKRKSRDLVFEEEDNKDKGVSTQTQSSKDIKQPFVVAFELKHN